MVTTAPAFRYIREIRQTRDLAGLETSSTMMSGTTAKTAHAPVLRSLLYLNRKYLQGHAENAEVQTRQKVNLRIWVEHASSNWM